MRYYIILHIILLPLTFSAVFAKTQANWGYYDNLRVEHCREDMGFSAFLALMPLSEIVVPFITGFYEHGIKFSCAKSTGE